MHAWVAQFVDALMPYIVAFAVAIVTVGTGAVYTWGRNRGLTEQTRGLTEQVKQLSGAGGKTTVVLPPAQLVGAGPKLLQAPVWNQLNDVLPDSAQDPYATTDCGEECTAMAIAACGGPSLPAGVLRQILGGPNRPGTSSGADLVYLLKLFGISAHVRDCASDVAWIEWNNSFKAGYLVIALGWFVTDGYPHWVLIRAIDNQSVTYNDPWGGQVKRMSKGWAMTKYQGSYVHIDKVTTEPAPEASTND